MGFAFFRCWCLYDWHVTCVLMNMMMDVKSFVTVLYDDPV